MSDSICRRLRLPNRGFRKEEIARIEFAWESLFLFRHACLLFFGSLGGRSSDFLALESKLENETIFYEIPNLILDLVEVIRGFLGFLKA